MVLVFYIVLAILIFFIVGILFSTMHINIAPAVLSNENSQKKIKYYYIIYFKLYLFNKIKWISLRIDETKMKQIKRKMEKLDVKRIEQELTSKKERESFFKHLKFRLEEFQFEMQIGTEDVILTSGLIAVISAGLGILLARFIKKYEKDKYKYYIEPIYQNRNVVNLKLNCIIQVKMVHIIYTIYVLLRKRSVEKHERTSNRRTYDYGYE